MSQFFTSGAQRPKYWSISFSISPSSEYSGLISFRMDWLDLLAVQGTLGSQASQSKSINLCGTLSSLWSNSHIHTWPLENHRLDGPLSAKYCLCFLICIDHWGRLSYLSLLFFGTLCSNGCIFPFLLCLLLLLLSQLFVKPPQILGLISIFLFLHSTWHCNPSINYHYVCFGCFTRNTQTYKFSV